MRILKVKDKKKRIFFNKFEDYKKISRSISQNNSFNFLIKWNQNKKRRLLPKNSSKIRFSNRCVISNRKKIIHKHFKLSRLCFLKFARIGLIHGITKRFNIFGI